MSKEELQFYKEIIYADKVFDVNFQNISKKLYKEIERLNNIINKLEEELFIKKEFYERELTKRPKNDSEYNTQYADSRALAQISVIYDKLQELKEKE